MADEAPRYLLADRLCTQINLEIDARKITSVVTVTYHNNDESSGAQSATGI
jgi:hypothetical protein